MAKLQRPHAQNRSENASAWLLLESRMGHCPGKLQIRRLGLPHRHSNWPSSRHTRTEIRARSSSRIFQPHPDHLPCTDSFSDPPPRPRLRHPSPIQYSVRGVERNVKAQQPPTPRRGTTTLNRLSHPRLQIRQPGLLAPALPHRLARVVGTGPADPGARTRHQPPGFFEEGAQRNVQDVAGVVRQQGQLVQCDAGLPR